MAITVSGVRLSPVITSEINEAFIAGLRLSPIITSSQDVAIISSVRISPIVSSSQNIASISSVRFSPLLVGPLTALVSEGINNKSFQDGTSQGKKIISFGIFQSNSNNFQGK